ncbi:tripartite tricarboxylate transporter TctB family protein [Pelagibius litoralis]|uniref:Tripartite tricarboxylate transporter TctB family protein n=1 Tax=Pelagibius litoralis TaxID=374515 RepID=A0A967EXI7_9PROT|nr:tripartite tricarboxylate transporter TctB family protein [Pelagibius litoralis]NIA69235.1 tripartite tricarboxylate transporter TctB family protein [Pelagibius litoralis]
MRRAEITTAVLLAAFSIYLMWKSAELPIGWLPEEGPGGGAFPFWLAVIMLGSCIWIIVNWFRRSSPPSQSSEPFMDNYAVKRFALVGGGVTAMIGLIHILGVFGSLPLFLIYYIRFLGRHSWATTLAIALSAPVVVFFFFDVALRIIMPKGYLEPLFLPLYDIFL